MYTGDTSLLCGSFFGINITELESFVRDGFPRLNYFTRNEGVGNNQWLSISMLTVYTIWQSKPLCWDIALNITSKMPPIMFIVYTTLWAFQLYQVNLVPPLFSPSNTHLSKNWIVVFISSCVNRKQCAGIIFSTVTPDNVYLHYLHMEHTHECVILPSVWWSLTHCTTS